MATIYVRYPLLHESDNDYEAIGRYVSMGIHLERMLNFCLFAGRVASEDELTRMRLFVRSRTPGFVEQPVPGSPG